MHIFFYGVLIDDLARGRARDLLEGIGPGRPATTDGRIYAVPDVRGAYPVFVHGAGTVRGVVYEVGDVDIEGLDKFEAVNHEMPALGQFRRETITVTTEDGEQLEAQAYVFNQGIGPEFQPVESGDFSVWLEEKGAKTFAG